MSRPEPGAPPTLRVVIASTRPGRAGKPIADWFVEQCRRHAGFTVEVTDLAELGLPMFDEPDHTRFGGYVHEHTRAWSRNVALSDAFVFVMPEYNHGFTAPLKNAIDFLHEEWAHKPVGFVSYGGVSGGTRAVQMLKPVLTCLRMVPLTDQVVLAGFARHLVGGVFRPDEGAGVAADLMLDELSRTVAALRRLRQDTVRAAPV